MSDWGELTDWKERELDRYKEIEQDALIRSLDPEYDAEQAISDLWLIRKEKRRIVEYSTRAMYYRFIGKEVRRREKLAELFYNLELRRKGNAIKKKWKWTRCRSCVTRSCCNNGIDNCVHGNRV